MFTIRKIVMSVSALLLGLAGMFMTSAVASADVQPYFIQCEDDWNLPCP